MEQVDTSVQEKIKEKSKWLLRIAGIIKAILIMACCLNVLVLVCYLIFPGWMKDFFLMAAAEDKHVVPKEVAAITYDNTFHPGAFFRYMILELIAMVLVVVIIQYLIVIFKTLSSQYTPFLPAVAGKLKKMSIVILIYQMFGAIMFGQSLLFGLLIGFAVYYIALIFEYGCDLQQMSDETL